MLLFVKFNNGRCYTNISYNIQTDTLTLSTNDHNVITISLYELKEHRQFIENYIKEKNNDNKEIIWKYDPNTVLTIKPNKIEYRKGDNNDSLSINFVFDFTYSNLSLLREKLVLLFKDILLYWNDPMEFIYKYSSKIECRDPLDERIF